MPFKALNRRLDEAEGRLRLLRLSYPELGRLRLLLLMLSNWPVLLLALFASGIALVRNGGFLANLTTLASIGGGVLLSYDPGLARFCAWAAAAMAAMGTWALFGVIATVFNAVLYEGFLSRLEELVMGSRGNRVDMTVVCQGYSDDARRDGRLDDSEFFQRVRERIAALQREEHEDTARLSRTLSMLRADLTETNEIVKADCFVKNFATTMMMFVASVCAFALLSQALSHFPKSFEPDGAFDFITGLYFSFTTVTTTDYGDICPGRHLSRLVAIWEQCFGVAFVTVVIGMLMSMARHGDASSSPPPALARGREKRSRRRIMAFVLSIYRDYKELSGPRREIDSLLDDVERRHRSIGAAARRGRQAAPS